MYTNMMNELQKLAAENPQLAEKVAKALLEKQASFEKQAAIQHIFIEKCAESNMSFDEGMNWYNSLDPAAKEQFDDFLESEIAAKTVPPGAMGSHYGDTVLYNRMKDVYDNSNFDENLAKTREAEEVINNDPSLRARSWKNWMGKGILGTAGAGIGGLYGGAIGATAGNTAKGAVIGAGIGALGLGALGHQADREIAKGDILEDHGIDRDARYAHTEGLWNAYENIYGDPKYAPYATAKYVPTKEASEKQDAYLSAVFAGEPVEKVASAKAAWSTLGFMPSEVIAKIAQNASNAEYMDKVAAAEKDMVSIVKMAAEEEYMDKVASEIANQFLGAIL